MMTLEQLGITKEDLIERAVAALLEDARTRPQTIEQVCSVCKGYGGKECTDPTCSGIVLVCPRCDNLLDECDCKSLWIPLNPSTMKISQAIELLEKAKAENGDIYIALYDRRGDELREPVGYDIMIRTTGLDEHKEILYLTESK